METNPFAAPESDFVDSLMPQVGGQYFVDGDKLVVCSGAVLPPVCVRTNEPIDEGEMKTKKLIWCPPWVLLLILINILVLAIVYFIVRKKCTLTFGLSPAMQRRYRTRFAIKALASVGLFVLAIAFIMMEQETPFIVTFVLFFLSLLVLSVGNSPLEVKKHVKGNFWISGCSKEFLASLVAGGQETRLGP